MLIIKWESMKKIQIPILITRLILDIELSHYIYNNLSLSCLMEQSKDQKAITMVFVQLIFQ